jgi:hypothetical protein
MSPPEVYAARKTIIRMGGRHVGLDSYDLLIEELFWSPAVFGCEDSPLPEEPPL